MPTRERSISGTTAASAASAVDLVLERRAGQVPLHGPLEVPPQPRRLAPVHDLHHEETLVGHPLGARGAAAQPQRREAGGAAVDLDDHRVLHARLEVARPDQRGPEPPLADLADLRARPEGRLERPPTGAGCAPCRRARRAPGADPSPGAGGGDHEDLPAVGDLGREAGGRLAGRATTSTGVAARAGPGRAARGWGHRACPGSRPRRRRRPRPAPRSRTPRERRRRAARRPGRGARARPRRRAR